VKHYGQRSFRYPLSAGIPLFFYLRDLLTIGLGAIQHTSNLHFSLQVSGKVTYNGHEMRDFVPERTAAYVSQHDLHIGEMTVRETLVFSARCQRVGYLHGKHLFISQLKKYFIELNSLMILMSFSGFLDLLLELLRREEASNIKPDVDIDVFMKVPCIDHR
jgi:hypothetical protein